MRRALTMRCRSFIARSFEGTREESLESLLASAPESIGRALEEGSLRKAEGLLRRAQKQGHDSPAAAAVYE